MPRRGRSSALARSLGATEGRNPRGVTGRDELATAASQTISGDDRPRVARDGRNDQSGLLEAGKQAATEDRSDLRGPSWNEGRE